MKKMKLWSLTLAAVLILSASALTACAKGEAGGDPQGEDPGDGKTDYDVTLYYVNEEYAVSGDESLSHLIPVEGKVKAQEKEAFKAAAEALKETPKEPAGLATMVTEEIEFLDVYGKTEEKTIYADLSSEHLNGGSLTERLLIEQVVETLLSSFGEQGYDKVQFLVNGEQAETLMGHMDTMEPFTRFNEEGGGVDAGE